MFGLLHGTKKLAYLRADTVLSWEVRRGAKFALTKKKDSKWIIFTVNGFVSALRAGKA